MGRHAAGVAELLVAVGAGGAQIAEGARRTARADIEILRGTRRRGCRWTCCSLGCDAGDTVLIKGSRAVGARSAHRGRWWTLGRAAEAASS